MDFRKLLKYIDDLLFTQNLRPEQQDRLYRLRGLAKFELERHQRANTFNALGEAFRRGLEMQNSNLLFDGGLIGGPRNIPGTEGSGIFIGHNKHRMCIFDHLRRTDTERGTGYVGSPDQGLGVMSS